MTIFVFCFLLAMQFGIELLSDICKLPSLLKLRHHSRALTLTNHYIAGVDRKATSSRRTQQS